MVIAGMVLDTPGSYLLMAAFIVVHVAALGDESLVERWCLSTYSIKHRGQWYRMLSSGFVHSGWMHLALNCLGIWYFATMVESLVGPWLMILLFLLSVLGGSIYAMRLRRMDHDYLAVGASGGVMGLMMMCVMWVPSIKLGLFILPIMLPGWLFALLINWGSMVFSLTDDRHRISHEGHLGGAFWGGMLGAIAMMVASYLFQQELELGSGFSVDSMEDLGTYKQMLFQWGSLLHSVDYTTSWVLLWAGILPVGLFWLLQEVQPSIFKRKWWKK